MVLRHLRSALQSKDQPLIRYAADTTAHHLAVAFTPDRALANLTLDGLEGPDKGRRLRTMETLGAASRLAVEMATLPDTAPQGDYLVPLFTRQVHADFPTRGSLQLASLIVEAVPLRHMPPRIVEVTLAGLGPTDTAALRANILAVYADKVQQDDRLLLAALRPLIPVMISPDASSAAIASLSRYVLPTLFQSVPPACRLILGLLDKWKADPTANYIGAWIMTAAVGSSLGCISLADLSITRLYEVIVHKDPVVRRQAFDLLANQLDVNTLLDAQAMTMFKQIILANAVLPGAA